MKYETFKRSATNFESFSKVRKYGYDRGLTLDEAQRQCTAWNNDRTAAQIRRGTKLEFRREE